ncbi:hypothetical protein LWI29_003804 [Acer saccharum]|uniref:Uncharacterized protein n=1 Tax=Acer saccharum TaxID=4024 RepID=A0AA39RTN6_ACESA|nr:hypothetical protein LWI29_003804 [Acer saccharum]
MMTPGGATLITLSMRSFGFVATAILISMFLVMAIFERFLRPTSPAAPTTNPSHADLESHLGFNPKLGYPSPKMTVYANGVSVLMPGDHIPTFIAHPSSSSSSSSGALSARTHFMASPSA